MVLRELGGPVRLEEVPIPKIGPNDFLIRGRATGVGSEATTIREGDRVTCHFYLTCKVCPFCRSGRETLCSDFKGYVGMACDGGYAEYMAIPALNVCPVPQGVTGPEG